MESTYKEVVEYLVNTIGCSLTELGSDDEKVKPYTEAVLIDFYEKYIYRDVSNYFLIGGDDAIYLYNGRYYETHRNNEDVLLNVIKDSMRRMGVGLVYQKNSYNKVFRQCLSGMKITKGAIFAPDRDYIVFNNGVLNLNDGKLNKFDMKYRTDLVLDFDYNKAAVSPLWDKVLCQTISNTEMRKAFQMFCGAFILNRKRFAIEYVCYMIGSGRNGKSVVTGAIASVFGDNLISSYSPQELFSDSDKSYNRAGLVGKIANFSDDVSKKDYSGGAYKQFTSGHKLSARNPFGKPFDLIDVPYLLCCVNEMPPSTDDTLGHYRRMLPIVCPNQISAEEADAELPAKLSTPEVKAAIMNWIIEGREMLIRAKGKIEMGETLKAEVVKQQESGNSARRWISETGLIKVGMPDANDVRWKPMSQWMNMYQTYCKDYSETPKPAIAVGKIFAEKGFESKRKKDGMWWCIGLLGIDTDDAGRLLQPSSSRDDLDDDLPF